jgi:hypothetical protein
MMSDTRKEMCFKNNLSVTYSNLIRLDCIVTAKLTVRKEREEKELKNERRGTVNILGEMKCQEI